jgi:hypothetical protein
MRAVKCPSCGAPVEFEEIAPLARCPFCGSTLAATSGLSRQVGVTIDLRRGRPAGRNAVKAVVATLLVVFAGTGLLLWFSIRTVGRAVDATVRPVERAIPEGKRPLPVERLASLGALGDTFGWVTIGAAPPPGRLDALDPVAALPWAVTIAQAWAGDATLTRVDVERLRPDGTVNVADDAEASVGFRFLSPAKIADYDRRAELSKKVESDFELMLRLERGELRGLVSTGAIRSMLGRGRELAGSLPAYPRSLALPELLDRARRGGHPQAPFLSGYLIHLENEGWVWYLSTLGGESLPRVRAADGRVWPFPS